MNYTLLPLIREKKQYQACLALWNVEGKSISSQDLNWLHPKEKDIYDNYSSELRRHSYLLGRLSSKLAVSQLCQTPNPKDFWIDMGIFNFPVVRAIEFQNIQVSISHSGSIGFSIAFPEAHPMGVDVERVDAKNQEAVLSQLTAKEIKQFSKLEWENDVTYTALFSIKEALSKILRTGMMLDFKFLEIDDCRKEAGDSYECSYKNFPQYKAYAFRQSQYIFSFALPRNTKISTEKIRELFSNCFE